MQSFADNSPSPALEGPDAENHLFCPECAYDLVGLPENRCPECGLEFDIDELRRRYSDDEQPVVPWDFRRTPESLFRTWIEVTFSPADLAKRFPNAHQRRSAATYANYTSLAAVAIVACGILPRGGEPLAAVFGVLAWSAMLYVGFRTCEASLATAFAKTVVPTNVKAVRHYWLGLLRYAGGFKIITAIIFFGMSITQIIVEYSPHTPPYATAIGPLLLLPVLWWVHTVARMGLPS